jgi:hypothetical protein
VLNQHAMKTGEDSVADCLYVSQLQLKTPVGLSEVCQPFYERDVGVPLKVLTYDHDTLIYSFVKHYFCKVNQGDSSLVFFTF